MPLTPNRLYLRLLKRALNNYLYLGGDDPFPMFWPLSSDLYGEFKWKVPAEVKPISLMVAGQFNILQAIMLDTIEKNVPGDFIETGVWNGGTCIFMTGLLKSLGVTDRKVWVADSFDGIPKSTVATLDPVDRWQDRWVCSYEQVVANFRRFDLLEDYVHFLKGRFADTLPGAPIDRLAVARLDGDSYESTCDALCALYPRISVGGYIYIDDWHIMSCRLAVEYFRKKHGIEEPIDESVDAMWRVERPWNGDLPVRPSFRRG
jgi:O-methyltransferase